MKQTVVLTLAILAAAWCPVAAAQTMAPPGAVIEDITLDSGGDKLTIEIRTTSPVPPFVVTMPSASSPALTIEFAGAASRLQESYRPDGGLAREIAVARGPGISGVQVRIGLTDTAIIAAVSQIDRGVRFLLVQSGGQGSAGEGQYRLGIGDKIEVSVFGHQDLGRIVEVRDDGTINLPLIGDIPVAGRGVQEIVGELTRRFGKDFLVDPQITVDVRESQSQWVTIVGEVRNPGRFALRRGMRLLDLVAEAGGITKEAGYEIVVLRQGTGGGDGDRMTIDRDHLVRHDSHDANLVLKQGDIVSVPEKDVFYIRGEVGRPGSYFIERGMTLMQALSVAGGLGPFANRKDVELLRTGDDGITRKSIVNVKAIEDGKKPDIEIRGNDLIIVPRRIF
jgi:polysaccharide export outer membrane protein